MKACHSATKIYSKPWTLNSLFIKPPTSLRRKSLHDPQYPKSWKVWHSSMYIYKCICTRTLRSCRILSINSTNRYSPTSHRHVVDKIFFIRRCWRLVCWDYLYSEHLEPNTWSHLNARSLCVLLSTGEWENVAVCLRRKSATHQKCISICHLLLGLLMLSWEGASESPHEFLCNPP